MILFEILSWWPHMYWIMCWIRKLCECLFIEQATKREKEQACDGTMAYGVDLSSSYTYNRIRSNESNNQLAVPRFVTRILFFVSSCCVDPTELKCNTLKSVVASRCWSGRGCKQSCSSWLQEELGWIWILHTNIQTWLMQKWSYSWN